MKRVIMLTVLMGGLTAFLCGCATFYPIGVIYTDLKLPIGATSNGSASYKVGTAECKSILSLIAIGDASVEAAKKNGKITKVYHVDWEAENVLGIFGKYKVTVYGE